jgi:hypothetical protein
MNSLVNIMSWVNINSRYLFIAFVVVMLTLALVAAFAPTSFVFAGQAPGGS